MRAMGNVRARQDARDSRAADHAGGRLAKRVRTAVALGLLAGVVALMVRAAFVPPGASLSPDILPVAGAGTPTAEVVPPPQPVVRLVASTTSTRRPAGPAQTPPPAPPEPAGWALPAKEIDLRRAVTEGDHLVQHLRDGSRVEFTVDPAVQRAAMKALERYQVEHGAVVAMRPGTGELLAYAEYAHGRPHLRHLPLLAEGPAASIFKMVTTAALLEQGALTPTSTICTRGGLRGLTLKHLVADDKRDRRCETLTEAFGNSTNAAFARWADQHLEPEELVAKAQAMLFDRRLPFLWGVGASETDIPGGSRLGFANAAAGFSRTSLSPLHAALLAAGVANDGVAMAPRLVRRVSQGDQELYRAEHVQLARLLPAHTAQQLGDIMLSTVSDGTAKKFFRRHGKDRIPGVTIAAKTGHLASRDGIARHYSWFVAFAPAEAPEIAIAALIVNGETWTTKGPVPAREALSAFFEGHR